MPRNSIDYGLNIANFGSRSNNSERPPTASTAPPKVLPFAAAVGKLDRRHPQQESFADQLQWLALERPETLGAIEDLVAGLVHRYRPPAPHAVIFETNADLKYTAFTVNNPAVLLASPDGRIGRYMGDVLPPATMEQFLYHFNRVKVGNRRAVRYVASSNGRIWSCAIVMPSDDRVIVTASDLGPIA